MEQAKQLRSLNYRVFILFLSITINGSSEAYPLISHFWYQIYSQINVSQIVSFVQHEKATCWCFQPLYLQNGLTHPFSYRNTTLCKHSHVQRYIELPYIGFVYLYLCYTECVGDMNAEVEKRRHLQKTFQTHTELLRGRHCRKTGLNLSQIELSFFSPPSQNQQERLQTVRSG